MWSEAMKKGVRKLIRETVGGETYEYYPVGRHIVVAPGVCCGRPTFKYTRIDVRHALNLLDAGRSIERVAEGYKIPIAAVREALALAAKAFDQHSQEIGRNTAKLA
jgi:uncharacterized protein (DUF433 family)